MNNIFKNAIENHPAFIDTVNALSRGETPIYLSGISSIHKSQFALSIYDYSPILIITDDEASAKKISDDLNVMSGEICSFLFPAKDLVLTETEAVSHEYIYARLSVLSKIAENSCRFICASAEAVSSFTIPKEILLENTILIDENSNINTDTLKKQLVRAGYVNSEKVEGVSQFSVRGAIIDIFPIGANFPVRIELWGDEVDTISTFEVETQRRIDTIKSVKIPPCSEILFSNNESLSEKISETAGKIRGKYAETAKENLYKLANNIKNDIIPANCDKIYSFVYENFATIFDYLPDDSIVIFSEKRNIEEKFGSHLARHSEYLKILLENGEITRNTDKFYLSYSEILQKSENFSEITMDTFVRRTDTKFKRIFSLTANMSAPWGGEIRQLIADLKSFSENGYSTIVMAGSEKTLPTIKKDLEEEGISCDILTENSVLTPRKVLLLSGAVSSGYDYPEIKTALITQSKATVSRRKLKKFKKGKSINSLSDIKEGELVVHNLHGIGRFQGIRKLELEGITKDYITIQFAGTDVLYVPVNQLDLVSKYIGPRDDSGVKLNKLSSNDWQKTKTRVRKAVKDMAEELTKLYAERNATKGYAFSKDTDWQNDFEGRFPYTETDDQLKSILEIKSDMESSVPMDRLLCGDVGFGKTEVAFRAAFKCMIDGKQCALLAPTTVLAFQHFQTALKRFEHFPLKIELLSRFRTKKQQEEILKQLKKGEIDLIIGTHRLVQNDVKFKDIGLAIIDEEQRFGVAHKEKFKELFRGIDQLTLSATPIPRTLNMAMSGIRDMSVIEEPPIDRYPVQTYVIEHDDGILLQAIRKELRRGGQVYYIHNRIETINACANNLAKNLPDARIAVAHGQITQEELSDVWQEVCEHEIDILVCTTLIETGVDVANVNTLIIENADYLGLSQLYQLRGRVGRSNRRAFAYFTFRRGKVMTEVATKRLDAIREFTQFGSGFRIAMRDLEIRGAGSILGGRQHGQMESVGYDMYIELLNEAIALQKGEAPPKKAEDCLIDLQIDAYIPEKYIESLSARIEIYRKIASIQSKDDIYDIYDELIDRFGEPPKSIDGLVKVSYVRNLASSLGIKEIKQRQQFLMLFITEASFEQIGRLTKKFKGRVTVNGSEKPYISVKILPKEKLADLMEDVIKTMAGENDEAET